ncbi:hypothetical protein ACPOL_3771 [Acidisarcina polymorpha]|uniref:Uncharacterized protein n=1 Tax=Acidisarcina polymorpha TaxID=2211140 RepID=A0A2Z5G202_9BACT|nr:hypothetical protein [Acidisarcina polymorpha]AXC13050.1 hypothetical protein ACPOL_3771 [Acidisarcina polymorpha]
MKTSRTLKGLFLSTAMLLSSNALAKNSGSLHLGNPVYVAGQTVPAGTYTVLWDGSGPEVEIKMIQGKTVVAATSAKLVNLNEKANNDSAVVVTGGDGKRNLSEIYFSDKKIALEIESPSDRATK